MNAIGPNAPTLPAQPPLPFAAAQDYEELVLGWARTQVLPDDVVAMRDRAYGPDLMQRYDTYRRRDLRDAPILVFWHGGGWTNGYKEYVSFMADAVTRLGMVLVAPGYRLAPEHPLPAGFDDALAALRHVIDHAGELGGRRDRIYLAGHSAGGHLAALAALRQADAQRAGVDTSAIRACLPISGIMDLHHPQPAPGSMEERIYTMVLGDAFDDAAMSPLCWTAENQLPFLLSFGDSDSERVARSNRRMASLLAMQEGTCRLDIEQDMDHFMTHTRLRDPAAPWYQRLQAIVQETLP
ncbi:alpha/beta fold hydrolase [Variovorax sp. J22R133]|uniref:alpha/beta hydrolase n=1 Tax=Variovorax brevis TaxID=3053503 RepID=UPI002576599F|nr:alpha/beta fold hydrolase [Variovorax sp. J22R133]MDM0116925.1 alpha/beta fold hydrolase [Variovorax sp. J22R133]